MCIFKIKYFTVPTDNVPGKVFVMDRFIPSINYPELYLQFIVLLVITLACYLVLSIMKAVPTLGLPGILCKLSVT